MKRIILGLVVLIVVILGAGWMVLSAPFFGGLRASVAQDWLDKAGGGVTISGPVSIGLGKEVHVAVEGVSLDAPGGEVSVARAEADLSLSDLLHRKIDPSNIVITGAKADLVRDGQGKLVGKVKDAAAGEPAKAPPTPEQILAALAGKTIRLVDSQFSLLDQPSNFAFDAVLPTLDLQGDSGNGVTALQGSGTLNGQPLTLSVSIPKDAPLSVALTSATTALTFTGADGSKGISGPLSGQIALEATDLTQTLKLLQLEPVLNGKASARATLGQTAGGDLSLTGIDVSGALDSGPSVQISGAIGNLRKMDDANITIDASLYAEGQEPAPALLVKDLRLTSVHMALSGPLKGDTHRSMKIVTNGFEVNTAGVGPAPVRLSEISRGQAGELVVGSLAIQIGPITTPWLTMGGQVGDLLNLSGVALTGQVDFPMATIDGADMTKLPASLGSVSGGFKVSGSIDQLSLTDIKLGTKDTDLWSLGVSGSVGSVLPLGGIDLTLQGSAQSEALLTALGKEPVTLSPLDFQIALASSDTVGTVQAKASVRIAESNVAVDLSGNNRGKGPVVKGTVTSSLIRLEDLRDGLLAATEIASAVRSKVPETPGVKHPRTRSQSQAAEDDVQDITIGILDKDTLLRYGDIDIALKFNDIAGKSKVKGIDANLTVGDGKASLGPLKFSFDGGHFDLLATIDTIAAPKIVHLKGSSGGWSFEQIMKAMRVKIPASGTLDAEFDLSGSHASVADFINTLDGSTTVRMKNGSIATSLLDLAGLGVIPWLFSNDRRQKYATITCLRAPLEFKNGVVSSKEAVIETPEVQLVAYGNIDIPRRTINVAGQPRPVGKPLKRSPWPFTLSGPLNHPKVKVKDGPSKVRRVDGATQMPAKRKPCVPDILQLK